MHACTTHSQKVTTHAYSGKPLWCMPPPQVFLGKSRTKTSATTVATTIATTTTSTSTTATSTITPARMGACPAAAATLPPGAVFVTQLHAVAHTIPVAVGAAQVGCPG